MNPLTLIPKLKKLLSFVLVLSISTFLFSCESGEPLEIYNPYMNTITVALDTEKEAIKVPANSFKEVYLDLGQHKVTVSLNEEIILEDSFTITENLRLFGSFMNLTKQDLIVYEETYGDDFYNTYNTGGSMLDQMIQLDSANAGKYEEIQAKQAEEMIQFYAADELVIKKDWKYAINQSFPESVEVSTNQSSVKYKKVFTYDNFLKYAEEMEAESY